MPTVAEVAMNHPSAPYPAFEEVEIRPAAVPPKIDDLINSRNEATNFGKGAASGREAPNRQRLGRQDFAQISDLDNEDFRGRFLNRTTPQRSRSQGTRNERIPASASNEMPVLIDDLREVEVARALETPSPRSRGSGASRKRHK